MVEMKFLVSKELSKFRSGGREKTKPNSRISPTNKVVIVVIFSLLGKYSLSSCSEKDTAVGARDIAINKQTKKVSKYIRYVEGYNYYEKK